MLGEIIKNFRVENNLTQKKLAEMLHLTANNVCEWEKGRSYPSYDILIKLADMMKVSTDYLLGRADDFGNITVVGGTEPLPPDERELLAGFRKLPEELRYLAKSYVNKLLVLHETSNPMQIAPVPTTAPQQIPKKKTGISPA